MPKGLTQCVRVCKGMSMYPTIYIEIAQRTSQKLRDDITLSPSVRGFALVPWLCTSKLYIFGFLVSSCVH